MDTSINSHFLFFFWLQFYWKSLQRLRSFAAFYLFVTYDAVIGADVDALSFASVRDQLPPGKRPDRGVACSLQQ